MDATFARKPILPAAARALCSTLLCAPASAELSAENWGLGPQAVLLRMEHGSPWVYGGLINDVWSLSSDKRGGSYHNFLIQPFRSAGC